ncbi:MAG: hypothetical protein AAGB01_03955 [Cyanobacteria bacterium P01_F01_bin.42]
MAASAIELLEKYSLTFPNEVLVVHAQIDGEEDEVVIFKGFSSSLMRSTAFDLDVPVLPADASIESVDRLRGPFNPAWPRPIEMDISWSEFQKRLERLVW